MAYLYFFGIARIFFELPKTKKMSLLWKYD